MSSTRGVRFQYRTGESVLCFEPDSTKAKVLYDARVLDISVSHDKLGRRQPVYLIHFLRWNSSWDRVVPESYLLKNTDENRTLMQKLTYISQKQYGRRQNRVRARKIERALKRHFEQMSSPDRPRDLVTCDTDSSDTNDDADDDDDDGLSADESLDDNSDDNDTDLYPPETQDEDQPASDDSDEEEELSHEPVKLDIPPSLREILQQDRQRIKVKHNLLRLPASANVLSVLESYIKTFTINAASVSACDRPTRMTRSVDDDRQMAALDNNVGLRKELVNGLRIIFDFTLPILLLYDSERAQYSELMSAPPPPSPIKIKLEVSSGEAGVRSRGSAKKRDRPRSENAASDAKCRSSSPSRARNTSPRKRRTSTPDDVRVPTHEPPPRPSGDHKRPRRSSKDTAAKDVQGHEAGQGQGHQERFMPPPVLAAMGSVTSSSRATSPDRPLPRLTAAVIPDSGISEHHPDIVASVLSWKLVPDEFVEERPAAPSVIYGAHHLLRLFVRLPTVLEGMYIPRVKLSHLLRHFALFIQYLADHRDEWFVDSAYTST